MIFMRRTFLGEAGRMRVAPKSTAVLACIRIGAEFYGASSTIDMTRTVKLCGVSLMTAWHFAHRLA